MQPVLRPDLPSAEELLPYLKTIEANAWATNNGPLVRKLEAALGGICVSSATLGLELAIRFTFRQGEVRIPALTFPATATAVIRAGLEPVLCDVDQDTWAIGPDERTLAVSPFGYPAHGPLVDAAGAYGIQTTGDRVISLHATKPLPAGEGGFVCGSSALLDYVAEQRAFGMRHGEVIEAGTNAKLSEYHAAVGLASLARYDAVKAKRERVAARYHANLDDQFYVREYLGGTMLPVLVDDPHATLHRLHRAGYEARRWYYPTLEQHHAFHRCKREPLPVTHYLASHLLCLPFHTFLSDSDVDRVSEVVCST